MKASTILLFGLLGARVLAQTGSPVILVHPQDFAAVPGSAAEFVVSATGSPPLSYSWWRGAQPVAGAVSPTLTLQNVTEAQAGDYFAVISNASGSVTSAPATLVVLPPLPGMLDPTFNASSIPNNVVRAVAVDPDGRIYVGGEFSQVGSVPRDRIARLHPDGSLDMAFAAGLTDGNSVYVLAVQTNRQVLVGGAFMTVNGQPRTHLARLNLDGSVDAGFNAALATNGMAGVFGSVWAIALQSDGKILIGGDFDFVDGAARPGIARLEANGSLDTSFAPGAGFNGSVRALAVQTDGLVLAGGGFSLANNAPADHLVRLTATGAVDATFFNSSGGSRQWINAITVQPDGRILVGGAFHGFGTLSRSGLVRLNSDGTPDASFDQGGWGPSGPVTTLALQPDGKVFLGGGFYQINTESSPFFARVTTNAAVDEAFYEDAGANYWVEASALQADGNILIGGSFSTVNGAPRPYLARLLGGETTPFAPLFTLLPPRWRTGREGEDILLTGRAVGFPRPSLQWRLHGTNLPGATNAVLVLENIRVAHGGPYQLVASSSAGVSTSRVAMLNVPPAPTTPGAVDVNYFPGDGPNAEVTSIAVQSDGSAIVAGYFSAVNGVVRQRIARLNTDGSLDPDFDPNPTGYVVERVSALPSGDVLMAGQFYNVGGLPPAGIALLRTNGSLDTVFRPQFPAIVYVNGIPYFAPPRIRSFYALTNGQVMVAGEMFLTNIVNTNLTGIPPSHVLRLNPDGTVDPSFNVGTGPNDLVFALAPHAGDKTLVAGSFVSFNATPRRSLVRLNSDGSVDGTFQPGAGPDGPIRALAVQPDGKMLVAGSFRHFNGAARNRLARLHSDGTLDPTFDPGAGPDLEVSALTLLSTGKIMIGGTFTSVSGVPRSRIARLNTDGSLDLIFAPGSGANDAVSALAEAPGGQVLVGGRFTYFDDLPRPYVARLHGSNPPPFAPVFGREPVSQLALAGQDVTFDALALGVPEARYQWRFNGADIPGATLWLLTLRDVRATNAGSYSVVASNSLGTAVSSNALLVVGAPSRRPGAPDISFNTGLGPNDRVHAVAVQGDRKIVIGGAFTAVNGLPRNRLARLNRNGSVDAGFDPGLGANDRVFALAVQADGKIVAGGSFTNINGVLRHRVARFETNGALDLTFDTTLGANAEVLAVIAEPDGRVVIGGRFASVGGAPRWGLARLQSNGSLDSSLDPALSQGLGPGSIVFALAGQPGGIVLAGGQLGEVVRLGLNGFLGGPGVSGSIGTLGLYPDGRVAFAGEFYTVGNQPRIRVARLDTNGWVDAGFTNDAPNATVNALLTEADGKLVLGGSFTGFGPFGSYPDEYGELPSTSIYARARLARLEDNGLLDPSFVGNLQGGSISADEYGQITDLTTVLALAREADGKILVAGDFTTVNGVTRPYLARVFGREASDAVAVVKGAGVVQLNWDTGVLQVADQVTGPWVDLPQAESPLLFQNGGAQKFFRLKFN